MYCSDCAGADLQVSTLSMPHCCLNLPCENTGTLCPSVYMGETTLDLISAWEDRVDCLKPMPIPSSHSQSLRSPISIYPAPRLGMLGVECFESMNVMLMSFLVCGWIPSLCLSQPCHNCLDHTSPARILPRGTSVVRMHGPGCSLSSP